MASQMTVIFVPPWSLFMGTRFDITFKNLGYCDIMDNLNMSLNCHESGILRQRTEDIELKKYCVTLLEEFGSLSYTRHTLEELDAELRAEIAKLGGNPMLEDVLDELLDWKREAGEMNSQM
jgi:hypothetical protein